MENFENAPLVFPFVQFLLGAILPFLSPFIKKEDEMRMDIKLLKFAKIEDVSSKLESILNDAVSFGTATSGEAGKQLDMKVSYTKEMIEASKLCMKYDRINKYYRSFRTTLFTTIVTGIILGVLGYFKVWGYNIVWIALLLIGVQLSIFFILRYYTNLVNKQLEK